MVSIPQTELQSLPLTEPYDLTATLESGQTFQWRRWLGDGEMFDGQENVGYYTVLPAYASPTESPEVFYVRQDTEDTLTWAATLGDTDVAKNLLRERLGLKAPFSVLQSTFPEDELLQEALVAHEGLRVPRDPTFPTLLSFICSSQMRVERIHEMQRKLADSYGDRLIAFGYEFTAFPSPEQVADIPEEALRDLKLGYRAKYVSRTAALVATDEVPLEPAHDLPYEEAREYIKQFVGVGNKVADCVLLFGFGFTEAVPIDTWIETALDDYYPDLLRSSYAATSRELREYFGPFAGIAQAYVFHHLRTQA